MIIVSLNYKLHHVFMINASSYKGVVFLKNNPK